MKKTLLLKRMLTVTLVLPTLLLASCSTKPATDGTNNGIGKNPEEIIGETYNPLPPLTREDFVKVINQYNVVLAKNPAVPKSPPDKKWKNDVIATRYAYLQQLHVNELNRTTDSLQVYNRRLASSKQSMKGLPSKKELDTIISTAQKLNTNIVAFKKKNHECKTYIVYKEAKRRGPNNENARDLCYKDAIKKYSETYKKEAAALSKLSSKYAPAKKPATTPTATAAPKK